MFPCSKRPNQNLHTKPVYRGTQCTTEEISLEFVWCVLIEVLNATQIWGGGGTCQAQSFMQALGFFFKRGRGVGAGILEIIYIFQWVQLSHFTGSAVIVYNATTCTKTYLRCVLCLCCMHINFSVLMLQIYDRQGAYICTMCNMLIPRIMSILLIQWIYISIRIGLHMRLIRVNLMLMCIFIDYQFDHYDRSCEFLFTISIW